MSKSLLQHERWVVKPSNPKGHHDFLSDYSNADEAWVVAMRNSKLNAGGYVYRFDDRFAVAHVGIYGTSRSKCWFESFDAAALFIQLETITSIRRRQANAKRYWASQRKRQTLRRSA